MGQGSLGIFIFYEGLGREKGGFAFLLCIVFWRISSLVSKSGHSEAFR